MKVPRLYIRSSCFCIIIGSSFEHIMYTNEIINWLLLGRFRVDWLIQIQRNLKYAYIKLLHTNTCNAVNEENITHHSNFLY